MIIILDDNFEAFCAPSRHHGHLLVTVIMVIRDFWVISRHPIYEWKPRCSQLCVCIIIYIYCIFTYDILYIYIFTYTCRVQFGLIWVNGYVDMLICCCSPSAVGITGATGPCFPSSTSSSMNIGALEELFIFKPPQNLLKESDVFWIWCGMDFFEIRFLGPKNAAGAEKE